MVDKKVKIIATVGPASNTYATLYKLAREGVDVFRINLSHAKKEEVAFCMRHIRDIEKKVKRPLTIMGDLAGPKIRVRNIAANSMLKNGQVVDIVKNTVLGTAEKFSINFPSALPQLEVDAEIYIDDGRIKLQVVEKNSRGVKAKVLVGGHLKPYKGFYAQGLSLKTKGMSPKDQEDIQMMVELGTDALAISFVQSEKDIKAVRKALPPKSKIMLVAKIETVKGIDNIEKIISSSDVIMVARGDLGLAVPMSEVPHLQKKLISMCLKKAKPVITATQMLESMTVNPLPTRAEVTDVANAILDGTDAVMLSGETAVGNFPIETVQMMVKIIRGAQPHVIARDYHDESSVGNAISASVGTIADQIHARYVFAFTQTGKTAHRISRHRHPQYIIALSPDIEIVRQLNFSWGVYPHLIQPTIDFENMRQQAKEFLTKSHVFPVKKREHFVIAAGMPFGEAGTTNMILIERV